MHRDVKRSLIIWPAAASATITAVSWFAQGGFDLSGVPVRMAGYVPRVAVETLIARSKVQLHGPPIVPVNPDLGLGETSPALTAEVVARTEHGTRAMQLPQRVAEVFGVQSRKIIAPILDPQKEIAGLVTNPVDPLPTIYIEGIPVPLAATSNGQSVAMDQQDRSVDRVHRSGISRSDPRFPASIDDDFHRLRFPSILPKSTRILGRHLIDSADRTDSQTGTSGSAEMNDATDESTLDWSTIQSPSDLASPGNADGPRMTDSHVEPAFPSQPSGISLSSPQTPRRSVSEANKPEVQRDVPAKAAPAPPQLDRGFAGWPTTGRLDEQLKELLELSAADPSNDADPNSTPAMAAWSRQVDETLQQLRTLPRLGEQQAGELIQTLADLAQQGLRSAEQLQIRQHQIAWLQASHAVARRAAVWEPVWLVSSAESPSWMVTDARDRIETSSESIGNGAVSLRAAVAAIRRDMAVTGDQGGWNDFLLLEEVDHATRNSNSRDRTVLAQRILSRLQWHGLSEEQQRWLDRDAVTQLAAAIRPWASGTVDYANLLRQIERQEADAIDMAAIDIANSVQSLRFTDILAAAKVGTAVDTFYRNANVRLALSDSMLQRMLPVIEPQTIPVRTRVFGSRVRGTSRIESDLRISLTPSPDRWLLDVEAHGKVQTTSIGVNGGVSVRTAGNSTFVAATPVEVSPKAIDLGDAAVQVDGRSRLRGIRSDYDGWPLVGTLVRNIAQDRYESLKPQSNRIANQKIRSEVGREFEERLADRVDLATQNMSEIVLGPLGRLRLDPKIMDLATTESRLLSRYRLAGDWQLGAFTPRPRAPGSSLMSVQVHQSAINNTFEQLIPRDHPMPIRDLVASCAETFGQSEFAIPDDIPDDVTVQFSKTRPITVEIEDGRLWVTLRVVRLRRSERVDLTQFIVRASYVPQVDGIHASLIREGHLRISGPGMSMRERLPIRAIFNKVLSPNRAMELTLPAVVEHPAMEGLAVSQLELRDGWIAFAISEQDAPRIALLAPSLE